MAILKGRQVFFIKLSGDYARTQKVQTKNDLVKFSIAQQFSKNRWETYRICGGHYAKKAMSQNEYKFGKSSVCCDEFLRLRFGEKSVQISRVLKEWSFTF